MDVDTVISFSGGRTSAFMLWREMQINDGLPEGCQVWFANTGKEEEATLEFVNECSQRWGVDIKWVEYRDNEKGYEIVDFDSASRDGEPFEALILKKKYLPNPVTRFCTIELKIRAMYKALKDADSIGDGIDMMLGIRADEPRRVHKIRNGKNSESSKITNIMPLADAGITVNEISKFWKAQPFDLNLPNIGGKTYHGNCDLCFLKGGNQILSLIQEKPDRADWWARMETLIQVKGKVVGNGRRFRSDRPGYAEMKNFTDAQVDWLDDSIDCFCGD